MDQKDNNFNSDDLLIELGGCGLFQVILAIVLNVSVFPSLFSFMIEPFGIYNPGWKCLDSDTTWPANTTMTTTAATATTIIAARDYSSSSNSSNESWTDVPSYSTTGNVTWSEHDAKMWSEYGHYSCPAYESCKRVEFSPGASTLVTEWGLICNRGWIISTMLSLRMAGYMASTLICGYVGDRFGRRLPFILSRFAVVALSLVSIFSVSWQMYAVISFATGFFGSYLMLANVLMTEYVTANWRVRIASLPTWSLIGIVFSLTAMAFPDWRTLRIITVVLSIVVLFFSFWMPKSLRWLSVKGKKDEMLKIMERISSYNKTSVPPSEYIDQLLENNQVENKSVYTVFHLFKKGYIYITLATGFIYLSTDLVYFGFNFGVAALPGNFFINLIIFSATDLPANIVSFTVANHFKRKSSIFTFFALSSLTLFGIVALDLAASGELKVIGTVVLVMMSKGFLYVAWMVLSTAVLELYPTVVRSTVNGYLFFTSTLGGILAPYLIPTDPRVFYICYLAMAVVLLVCTGLILNFPETKGKPLKDTWDEEDIGTGQSEKCDKNLVI